MMKTVRLVESHTEKKVFYTYITFLPCFLKHCIDSLLTVC